MSKQDDSAYEFIIAKTGEQIKVDKDDFEDLKKRSWRVSVSTKTGKPSVITSIRTGDIVRTVSMGQYLMRPGPGLLVFPRRWQGGLDYRKSNLIVCTMKERQRMLPKRGEASTSKYKGVTYIAKKGLWRSRVEKEGVSYFLGDFQDEDLAAVAYNEKARELFGDSAYMNPVKNFEERRKELHEMQKKKAS